MRPPVGVLLPDTGFLALEGTPLGCFLFGAAGEFDRVEGVLDEPVGLFNFRTDKGSFEEDGGTGDVVAWFGFLVAGLRETAFGGFCEGASLKDRP